MEMDIPKIQLPYTPPQLESLPTFLLIVGVSTIHVPIQLIDLEGELQ